MLPATRDLIDEARKIADSCFVDDELVMWPVMEQLPLLGRAISEFVAVEVDIPDVSAIGGCGIFGSLLASHAATRIHKPPFSVSTMRTALSIADAHLDGRPVVLVADPYGTTEDGIEAVRIVEDELDVGVAAIVSLFNLEVPETRCLVLG